MSVKFYMDVHVTTALRLRGDRSTHRAADDPALLARADSLGRILISQDDDLLREGTRLQREGLAFAGPIYGHQHLVGIGQMVDDLTLIATATEASEWVGRIGFMPF